MAHFFKTQDSAVTSSHVPTERSFGLSVGGALLVLAVLCAWRWTGPTVAIVIATPGLVLVTLALVAPAALRIPNRVWWSFAQVVGWVNSRILLTLFFLLVMTPIGLAMRLFGRNLLKSTTDSTGWLPYSKRRADVRHYEHLF